MVPMRVHAGVELRRVGMTEYNRDMDHVMIQEVARQLAASSQAVVFTGAGISTESGIADFRSPGGVWTRYRTIYFDEFLASHEARAEYWKMKREGWPEMARATPNAGHRILAKWERQGRLAGVITQNIDGLHAEAGSARIYELHGTQLFVDCVQCGKRWPARVWFEENVNDAVPQCDACGGWLKPATVSFGQSLPQDVLEKALELACASDVFLAIGSSLVVEPAASLPVYARRNGATLVILNRDETPLDEAADAVLRSPIGVTLEAIDEALS